MSAKKRDWVKIIAIILAILFLITTILSNIGGNILITECQNNLNDLHYKWQQAYTTAMNCYENNLPSCRVNIPNLP